MTIQLPPGLAAGTTLTVRAFVADRIEPMILPAAIRVAGPRPSITDLTVSEIPAQSVQLGSGELPDGQTLSAMIHGSHFPIGSGVKFNANRRKPPEPRRK